VKITHITVTWNEGTMNQMKDFGDGYNKDFGDGYNADNPVEDFLNWLIAKGIYTEIQCTKTHTLTKAVLKKLEGE